MTAGIPFGESRFPAVSGDRRFKPRPEVQGSALEKDGRIALTRLPDEPPIPLTNSNSIARIGGSVGCIGGRSAKSEVLLGNIVIRETPEVKKLINVDFGRHLKIGQENFLVLYSSGLCNF